MQTPQRSLLFVFCSGNFQFLFSKKKYIKKTTTKRKLWKSSSSFPVKLLTHKRRMTPLNLSLKLKAGPLAFMLNTLLLNCIYVARLCNIQRSMMVMPQKSAKIALRVNEVSQCDVGKLWWKRVTRPLQPPRPCKMAPVKLRSLANARTASWP